MANYKILQINAAAASGGAGRVMIRLHHEFARQGHSPQILARLRRTPAPGIHTVAEIDGAADPLPRRLINNLRMQLDAWFSLPRVYRWTERFLETDLFAGADLLQLHNLHGWYFDYNTLPAMAARKPIVWTLHDMWALTGHCAYSYDCQRWQEGCFACPLLRGEGRTLVEPRPTLLDRTPQVWANKHHLYRHSDLHVVTPSRWLASKIEQSILASAKSIQCIPNGVDLDIYRPVDRDEARRSLNIPLDARVILFVAARVSQQRKGFSHLVDALVGMTHPQNVLLLTIGQEGPPDPRLQRFPYLGLGQVTDQESQNLVYNAADLFVTPTLADNQPLVVIEALASGTPVVSFDVGGLSEMVHPLETGYLARSKDARDLAAGIRRLLEDDDLRARMRQRCRQVAVERYSLQLQARRYLELYQRAIQEHRNG